jgi:spore coat protein U-like protein
MRIGKLLFALTTIEVFVVGSDSPVVAGSATANLQISAAVNANCTITTAAVAFPTYDPVVANAAANDDGTGTVTITCTKGTLATIGLGLGANALVNQRRMKDATTDYLNYALYLDAARTTIWGTASPNLLTPVAAPDKTPRPFTVYGRIPSAQDVPAGAYSDTVVATVNF